MTYPPRHLRHSLATWGAGALLLATAPAASVQAQQTQQVTNPEARYQEAVRLYQRQLYGPAQTAFREFLAQPRIQQDPDRAADAVYYAAVSGLRLLQPDAEGQMLGFARHYPAHPKAALAYFELGRFYFERKDYERALANLKQVEPKLLTQQQRYESDFKLAYSQFSTKQYEPARLLFDRIKTGKHEFAPAARYYAGFLALRSSDYDGARADLEEAGKSPAYKNVVPQLITQILYRQNKLPEVIAYGESALAGKPQGAEEIQLLVGDSYFQQEDYAKALPPLLAAAGKPGGRGKRGELLVEYKAGYAAYKTQDYKTAVARFQPVAAQRDSLGQLASYHLGLSYLKQDNKPFALTAFEESRNGGFDPKITEQSVLKVAEIAFEEGNSRAVINALQDFDKKFPKSKQSDAADDMLSEAYLNSNDYAAAIRHIEAMGSRSARLNQTYQRVTYYQAVQEYNAGRPDAALTLLNKSLQNPGDAYLRNAASFLKGEALSGVGRWEEAAQAYQGVYRLDRTPGPGETDWYRLSRYSLAYAYFNSKQYDQALVQFKSYLEENGSRETDPNVIDATLRLADCFFIAKDYTQAVLLYDKVLAANGPNQDVALFQKGVTLGLAGKREQAVATLAMIPQNFPQSTYLDNALFQQAQFEFEAGHYGPAVQGFTAMIERAPQSALVPQALTKRGIAYTNQQQYTQAVADFKKILDEYPNSKVTESALYSLQEALTAASRPEDFDPYLATYKQRNPGAKSLETVEFESAKSLYFAEKYELAAPKFESFLRQYPNNAAAPDARYFIADSHIRGGDKKNGLTMMADVVQEAKTQYLNKGLRAMGDVSYEMQQYDEAMKYYQRLAQSATTRRDVAAAQLGMMRASFASGDYARTRQTADQILAGGAATVTATNQALLYKAKSSLATPGQRPQGIEELRAVVKAASDENGAEAQYLLAYVANDQKQYKEAVEEALKVTQNYAAYDLWIGRSFLLLADVYAAQNEIFQARATLNSLIDGKFPVPEVLEQARQKLASLNASGKTVNP